MKVNYHLQGSDLSSTRNQPTIPYPLDSEVTLCLSLRSQQSILRGVLAAEQGPQAGRYCQTLCFPRVVLSLLTGALCFFSIAYHNSPPGLNSSLSNNSALPPTQTPEMPQPRPFRLESLDIPISKAKRKKSKNSFGGEPL